MEAKRNGNGHLGDLEEIIRAAYLLSVDLGEEVERLFAVGKQHPLDEDEARALLRRTVSAMKRGAERRGDAQVARALSGDVEEIVETLIHSKKGGKPGPGDNGTRLAPARPAAVAGPERTPVVPSPVFHGRRVAMYQQRMKTTDIHLWVDNERLDIHLQQFQALESRLPTNEEILKIMHGVLQLPGMGNGIEDEFEIVPLAESIAHNGVRRPPILDSDGHTLLDGNRRVAACYYVLSSGDFTPEQKRQAEEIWVWQLTEHAEEDDRQAVIVSLNFEEDCKLTWPDYVKARRIADEYESMKLRIGERNLDKKRELEIRKDIARRFALKPARVSLYLQMVEWADKFEEYHRDEKKQDPHAVKHNANRNFWYFKELSDGMTKDDGVARILSEDPDFRALTFDLLFDDKFLKFESIRLLKYRDDQMERELRAAAAEKDKKIAIRDVNIALNAAYQRVVDKRRDINADHTIRNFVKFLENMPPKTYLNPEGVSLDSLHALVKLSSLAAKIAKEALEARGGEQA